MSFWGDLFGLTPQKSRPTAAATVRSSGEVGNPRVCIVNHLLRVYGQSQLLLKNGSGTVVTLYVNSFDISDDGKKVTLKIADSEFRPQKGIFYPLNKAEDLLGRAFPGIFTVRHNENMNIVSVDFEAIANTAALLKALGKLPNHHSHNNGSGKVRSGEPTVKGNSR